MALDVGEKRIGVALSDPTGTLASVIGVIERRGLALDVRAVDRLAAERGAEMYLVGNPLSLSGEVGPQSRRVQRFVDGLKGVSELPVAQWDERYSTVDAGQRLAEAGVSGRRRKGKIDASAAAVFLQDYLDSQKEQRS
jgi:putative holliday junction resolvase